MNINYEKNMKYKKKYNYLKRNIKDLLIENAALCDEVAKTQENIVIVKEERKILLKNLMDYDNNLDSTHSNYKISPSQPQVNGTKVKKRKSPDNNGKSLPMP